jgi:hypothetical protein
LLHIVCESPRVRDPCNKGLIWEDVVFNQSFLGDYARQGPTVRDLLHNPQVLPMIPCQWDLNMHRISYI